MRYLLIAVMMLVVCGGSASAAILVEMPNGTRLARTSLTAAASAADGTGRKVIITSAYTLTGDFTWPADRPLEIAPGGSINRAGYVLTIPGDFTAGRYLVFTGSGSTKFTDATSWASASQKSNTRVVYPEWFPGGVQEAAYSIAAQTASTTSPTYLGGRVLLAPKYYPLTTTLIIPDHVWIDTEGGGMRQATLQATGSWTATNPVVQLGRVLGTQYWSHDARIRNCSVDANFKANTAIYSASVNEGSGVENVIVRNYLLKGVHYEDIHATSTDPRIMHTFIREVQAFAPVALYPLIYPTPANVRGIEISAKVGVAAERTAPVSFTNFTIDKCTVSSVAGQNDASPVLIGAGFYFNGVSGVTLTNSKAEYAAVDVVLGDNYPVRNMRVTQFDGYKLDPITVQIGAHTNTASIVLENIYSNDTGGTGTATVQDLNTIRRVDITENWVTRYSVGRQYFVGNGDSWDFRFSRQTDGAFVTPSGTIATFEHSGGQATVRMSGTTGGQIVFHGRDGTSSETSAISGNHTGDLTLSANGSVTINPDTSGLTILLGAVPQYADNATAKGAGLANGRIYRTATGQLMIVY